MLKINLLNEVNDLIKCLYHYYNLVNILYISIKIYIVLNIIFHISESNLIRFSPTISNYISVSAYISKCSSLNPLRSNKNSWFSNMVKLATLIYYSSYDIDKNVYFLTYFINYINKSYVKCFVLCKSLKTLYGKLEIWTTSLTKNNRS
jgi:hypothetical protein